MERKTLSEQGPPKPRGRMKVHWRKDPVILARLPEVERRHLAGATNVAIAAFLGVDEATVRTDLKRLNELWLEQAKGEQAEIRARTIRKLRQAQDLAIEAYYWDRQCECDVLYGGESGSADQASSNPNAPAGKQRKVYRDDKGSATFRGNKAQALNVYRQAVMDEAKVQGVVVDKVAPTNGDGQDLPIDALMERYARARAAD